jgi:Asp-tRNA(Asn)/Glu-tRNA(Gln) amidotransferase C subunit
MREITPDVIVEIAGLAGLALSKDELPELCAEISQLVTYMDQLGSYVAAKETAVKPGNVQGPGLRPDEIVASLPGVIPEACLEDGFLIVPRVLASSVGPT